MKDLSKLIVLISFILLTSCKSDGFVLKHYSIFNNTQSLSVKLIDNLEEEQIIADHIRLNYLYFIDTINNYRLIISIGNDIEPNKPFSKDLFNDENLMADSMDGAKFVKGKINDQPYRSFSYLRDNQVNCIDSQLKIDSTFIIKSRVLSNKSNLSIKELKDKSKAILEDIRITLHNIR